MTYNRHDKADAEQHLEERQAADPDAKFILFNSADEDWPFYEVARLPQVGDEISYGFNGDSYPCGTIIKISKTMKKITGSEGDLFWRDQSPRRRTTWRKNKTWTMTRGHTFKQNPHF